jgi:hypothetical protein
MVFRTWNAEDRKTRFTPEERTMRMPDWLKIVLNSLGANFDVNPVTPVVVEQTVPAEPVDPRSVPVTLTKGELDDLKGRVRGLESTVSTMTTAQSLVVRRLLSFAHGVAGVIGNVHVTGANVVDDNTAEYMLANGDAPVLHLVVTAFGNQFTLRPANTTRQVDTKPLTMNYEPDGTLSRINVLAIRGYADVVQTCTADNNDTVMVEELTAMLRSTTPASA